MPTIQEISAALNNLSGATRQAIGTAQQAYAMAQQTQQVVGSVAQMTTEIKRLIEAVGATKMDPSGSGRVDISHIESIPGRRIPYDLSVKIPINSTDTNPIEVQTTLSQDGPFVAVMRYAVFQSAYQFQVSSGASAATFNGRSYGRYRPVSSALDIMDAQGGFTQPVGAAAPGDGLSALVASNQHAGFRTMELDCTIEVESGSGYRRQSDPVPSALWAPGFEQMVQLPVLDFFERGDMIKFRVQPQHVNNPPAGNVQSLVGSLPYLASQYDAQEGICYTTAVGGGIADTITRQPDGILTVGYFGFKILGAPTMP